MTPTALSPALDVYDELRREIGNVPPDLIATMDFVFADDERKNGEHSIEFRRGLAACARFIHSAYENAPPHHRETVMASIPVYFSGRFLELLEVIGPRPGIQ